MPLPQCVPSGNGPSRPRGSITQGFWGTCSWMGVCRSRDAAKPNRWLCALHSALWQARSSFRSGSCTLPSTSSWLDCSESRMHLILLFPFPFQRRKQPEWGKSLVWERHRMDSRGPEPSGRLSCSWAVLSDAWDVTNLPVITQALVQSCFL